MCQPKIWAYKDRKKVELYNLWGIIFFVKFLYFLHIYYFRRNQQSLEERRTQFNLQQDLTPSGGERKKKTKKKSEKSRKRKESRNLEQHSESKSISRSEPSEHRSELSEHRSEISEHRSELTESRSDCAVGTLVTFAG